MMGAGSLRCHAVLCVCIVCQALSCKVGSEAAEQLYLQGPVKQVSILAVPTSLMFVRPWNHAGQVWRRRSKAAGGAAAEGGGDCGGGRGRQLDTPWHSGGWAWGGPAQEEAVVRVPSESLDYCWTSVGSVCGQPHS